MKSITCVSSQGVLNSGQPITEGIIAVGQPITEGIIPRGEPIVPFNA